MMTDPVTPPIEPTPPTDSVDDSPKPLLGAEPAAPTPFDPATFTYPEGVTFSDEDKTFLSETAAKYSIPHQAMEALVGRYASTMQAASDGMSGQVQRDWDETIKGWQGKVKETYGPKLEEALVRLESVIDRFGDDEFRSFLSITGAHSHPAVFAFLEKVHAAVGEAKPVLPNGAPAAGDIYATMYPTMVNMKGNG